MKLSAIITAALLSMLSFSAHADIESGWYVSLFGGLQQPRDMQVKSGGTTDLVIDHKLGYAGGGAFGYKSASPMRYEGELTYMRAQPNNFTEAGASQGGFSGETEALAVMANVYYDILKIHDSFTPYVGAGIGYGHVTADIDTNVVKDHFRASGGAFAYQGILGMAYYFTDEFALTLDGRYLGTSNIKVTGKNNAGARTAGLKARYETIMGTLGIIWIVE